MDSLVPLIRHDPMIRDQDPDPYHPKETLP